MTLVRCSLLRPRIQNTPPSFFVAAWNSTLAEPRRRRVEHCLGLLRQCLQSERTGQARSFFSSCRAADERLTPHCTTGRLWPDCTRSLCSSVTSVPLWFSFVCGRCRAVDIEVRDPAAGPGLRPVAYSWISRSTTSGSANVVMSPMPHTPDEAILRRCGMILPLRVFGKPEAMWTTSGAARPIVSHLLHQGTHNLVVVAVDVVVRQHHVGVDSRALDRVGKPISGPATACGHQRLQLGCPGGDGDVEHVVVRP